MTGADRFLWHPAARLVGSDPARTTLQPARCGAAAILAADPAPEAIANALGRAAQGLAFRIGAPEAPAPDPGPLPMFETLTSGSTGQPRRIRRSQRSWIASFAVNAGLFGIGPGSRSATLGALTQSLSLYGALEGAHLGSEVHLLAALRPDRQRQALADRGIGLLYATPAQLRAVLDAPGPALPRLGLVLCGGSKLDPDLRAALAGAAPAARVCEFYGAAEASFITLADPDCPPEAVGRPYPGVELALRDPQGLPLGLGENGAGENGLGENGLGEVWVKSPYLFDGYAGRDEAPARWQDGWLSVGEYGRLRDGHLVLAGRAGRMVTVADQNVFPEEIEAFLQGLPGVRQAAVLPRPDRRRGQVLVAVLQGDSRAEAAILAALRQRLGPLQAPRRLAWRQDWPLLASGKTDLAVLAQGLAQGLAEARGEAPGGALP